MLTFFSSREHSTSKGSNEFLSALCVHVCARARSISVHLTVMSQQDTCIDSKPAITSAIRVIMNDLTETKQNKKSVT
jgi:phage tail protein X